MPRIMKRYFIVSKFALFPAIPLWAQVGTPSYSMDILGILSIIVALSVVFIPIIIYIGYKEKKRNKVVKKNFYVR